MLTLQEINIFPVIYICIYTLSTRLFRVLSRNSQTWLGNISEIQCMGNYVYLINSITPCSKVLPENLICPQPLEKFPAFCGTRKFITVITTARHLTLPGGKSIQSMPPKPTSRKSILILPSHLRLGLSSYLLPSGLPTKTL